MWPQFSESLERRVMLFGGPPDLSPLSIPGLVENNGVFTANNPTISVNGTPTVSLQGTVTVANNQISGNGQVSAAFGGNQLLFGGSFVIPVGSAATNTLSDTLGAAANRLPLGGTSLTFANMTLSAGGVKFDATAKLPAALGSFELNATNVQLGASGVSAATLGVNDPNTYQFNLGGFKLNAQSLAATYDVASERVKLNGLFNAPQLNTTVDLSGNKFIAVGSGPSIEFAGGVSIDSPVTVGGPWKLNSLDLQIAYQNNDFTTTGAAVVDTGGGNIDLQASFANSAFNFSLQGQASFELLGMALTVSSLTFVSDQSNGGSWDPKVTVQGSLQLPQQFGSFTITIDQANQLTVDSTGVQLTGGTASLPGNQSFSIVGLLEVKTVNATLAFDFQQSEVKLQGSFTVPTLNNLTLNLAGNNFAGLRFANNALDFAFVGSFANINIPIYQQWALQNGSLTINKPYGTSPGDISGSFEIKTPNNTTIGLSLTFTNGRLDQITATNNNPNPDFTFFGVSARVTKVKFIPDITPGNDDDFEPQLELQGSLSLPTSFGTTTGGGRVTFAVNDPEKFVLNENSITLTGGSISIPNLDFNLLNVVKVSAQSLNVQYISTPTAALRISGIVKIPQLFNLELNFDPAQNRFIQLDSGGNVTVNGQISVRNVAIVPNLWVIKEARFLFNNTGASTIFEAGASIQVPGGAIVEGNIRFVGGDLDKIFLAGDNLRIPLGATGVFLQRIGGGLENLANPTGNPPLKFQGTLGLSFGPRINFALPALLGGIGFDGSLLDLTTEGSIDRNGITVGGRLSVVGNSRPQPPTGLVTGTANLILNWSKGTFQGDAAVNMFDGMFTGNVSVLANSQGVFALKGSGAAAIPNAIPVIGGFQLAGAEGALYFTNNGSFSDDFIAAWGTISLFGLGDVTRGLKIFFDGNYEILTSEVSLPPILTNTERAEFDLTAGTPKFVVKANWSNAISPTATNVQFFDSNTQQLIDVTNPNNGIADQVQISSGGGAKRNIVLTNIRRTGRFVFSIVPPEGQAFANTQWTGGIPNTAPTINPTGATVANLSNVTINYTAADPDNVARITFFTDNDNVGFNGSQIQVYRNNAAALDVPENDAADSVEWRAGERIGSYYATPSGTYFIYAKIEDGVNAPVFRYLPAPVTIDTNENPHVLAMFVDSSKWKASFKTRLAQAANYTDDGLQIVNAQGVADLAALPWNNLDRIVVALSKPVDLLDELQATLNGVTQGQYAVELENDVSSAKLIITGFDPASTERLIVTLSETLESLFDGQPFDGNNDGQPGDAAELPFNVLDGDINRDGTVNLNDFTALASGFFGSAAGSSSSGYSPFSDFDGSGAINLIDFTILAANFGRTLPPAPRVTRPPAGMAVFSTTHVERRVGSDSYQDDRITRSLFATEVPL